MEDTFPELIKTIQERLKSFSKWFKWFVIFPFNVFENPNLKESCDLISLFSYFFSEHFTKKNNGGRGKGF